MSRRGTFRQPGFQSFSHATLHSSFTAFAQETSALFRLLSKGDLLRDAVPAASVFCDFGHA